MGRKQSKKQIKNSKIGRINQSKKKYHFSGKRKSRENTLALVRQYAQEARAKRAAAEAAATQPSQEKVRQMHGGYYGDDDNMEEDDDVIIPDGLQSEVPPFYVRPYYRIPNYKIKIIHSLNYELLNQE